MKVGEVVLIQDDTPRIDWKLAVVEELIEGKDGLVRAAHIRTAQGRTNRPISKLCPLEVSSDESQAECVEMPDSPDSEATAATEAILPRPQRRSKEKAREQISSWIRDLGGPEDV